MTYVFNRTTKRMVITAKNGLDITKLRAIEAELKNTKTYYVVTSSVGPSYTMKLELPLIPQSFVDSLGK